MGHVPSETILECFAKGTHADLTSLRIAAGYQPPLHVIQAVEMALRDIHGISDEGKQRIMEFVREAKEKYGVECPGE